MNLETIGGYMNNEMKYYLVSIGETNGDYEYQHGVLLHTDRDDIEQMLGHLGATWYGGDYDPELDVFENYFSNGDVSWAIHDYPEISHDTHNALCKTFINDLSHNYINVLTQ